MSDKINIDPAPYSTRQVVNGNVAVTGNSDDSTNTLRALFGVVLQGTPSVVPGQPWLDPTAPDPGEGTVNNDGTWSVTCPGARGGGLTDTIVVWGFFDNDATICPASDVFIGQGNPGVTLARAAARQARAATAGLAATAFPFEAMPRHYRLRLDLSGSHAHGLLGSLIMGELLRPAEVVLAFDLANAVLDQPIWRALGRASDSAGWILQLRCTGTMASRAVLQRLTPTRVLPPLVWQTNHWNLFGTNVLQPDAPATAGVMPPLVVEPK